MKQQKNDISALLVIFFILGIFAYIVILNPPKQTMNEDNHSSPKVIHTPETAKPPAQPKFFSTYIDSNGNTHEVTDYTSQGGSKYDRIINNSKTDKPVLPKDDSNNLNNEYIEPLKKSINKLLNKPETDKEKIIGKWEFNTQSGYMIYYFKEDGTGTYDGFVDKTLFGVSISEKQFFKYNVSQGYISQTDIKPCYYSCNANLKYEFVDDNVLIMNDMVYEKKWI